MRSFKNLFLLLISATLIIVFQGCNKSPTGSEEEDTDEIKLSEKTEVLADSTISKIDHELGDSVIYFNKDAQEILQLEDGDVIVSSVGEGFLRKVKETKEEGDYIIVRTEYAALEDAIEKGNLVISNRELNFDNMRTEYKHRGTSFKTRGNLLEVDFNSLIYENPTTGAEIRGIGKSVFGAVIDTVGAEFLFGLQSFKFGLKVYHSESLGVEITEGCSFEGKIKLASFTLTPILVHVGIPIVITPHVDLYIGANLNVQASVSTSIQKNDTIIGGIIYNKSQGWETFSDYKKSFSYSTPTVSLSGEAEIYAVVPEISLQIYELIGPYAEMKGYGKIEVDPQAIPWWVLYGGFDVEGGVKMEILAWDITWAGSIYSKEWELASASGGSPGTQKWKFPTEDEIHSSPAIGSDGTIYVGSNDNNLYAIDPSNGSEVWRFESGGSVHSSPAIGTDGTIYVGSYDNNIYAINLDGSQKWNFPTRGDVSSSPAIGDDGTIYVGSFDSSLYAINPDGSRKWAFETEGILFHPPSIGADGTIYIGSNDNNLYAINSDGSEKWIFPTEDDVGPSPAIGDDGTIYVGSSDNHLYALNPNGTQKWAFSIYYSWSPPSIASDGTIYVSSEDGNLYAINPDGTQKWAFSTGAIVRSAPAIGADGTIYIGSNDNNLYAIDPDGSEKWVFSTEGFIKYMSPSIGLDGTIYVGSYDNNIYAIYGSSGGLANTPWPMFNHDLKHSGRVGGP